MSSLCSSEEPFLARFGTGLDRNPQTELNDSEDPNPGQVLAKSLFIGGQMRQWNRLIVTALLTLSWIAQAQAPVQGQLIELQGLINARQADESGRIDFRKETKNRLYVLAPYSRGKITEVQKLKSGNFGLKVKVFNVKGVEEEVWLYYQHDEKNPQKGDPHIKLFDMDKASADQREKVWKEEAAAGRDAVNVFHKYHEVKNPEQASHIQTQTSVQAVGAGRTTASSIPKTAIDGSAAYDQNIQIDQNALNRLAVIKISDANTAARTMSGPAAQAPTDTCIDCKPKPVMVSNMTCTAKNNYIEELLQNRQSLPAIQLLTAREPQSPKLMSCIETEMARAGGKFIDCDRGTQTGVTVPKACSSLNYKKVVTNAFELVNDCLLSYTTGSQDPKVNANMKALYYSMVSQESGFHVNIRRVGGMDSGLLQFVQDGITSVNGGTYSRSGSKQTGGQTNYFADVMSKVQNSTNSSCQSISQLNLTEMQDHTLRRCDAISFEKGNPILNLVYGMGLLKANRDAFVEQLKASPAALKNWNKLPAETQAILLNYASAWSHNYPADRAAIIRSLANNQQLMKLTDGHVETFIGAVQGAEKKPYIMSLISKKNYRGAECVN